MGVSDCGFLFVLKMKKVDAIGRKSYSAQSPVNAVTHWLQRA